MLLALQGASLSGPRGFRLRLRASWKRGSIRFRGSGLGLRVRRGFVLCRFCAVLKGGEGGE